ncbi:MAG TPA: 2-oxoglutarate dehydrogenase E1 component [Acidobacteriota bacterium]|nr:2-oxoglutarate dehydrogenase E1 component [Acidobacteriota bacterium]
MHKDLGEVSAQNAEYIESLYQRYLQDPASVEPSWRYFFQGVEFAREGASPVVSKFTQDTHIFDLIHAYRKWGHLIAKIDPLGMNQEMHPELELENLGFSEDELDATFPAVSFIDQSPVTLRQVRDALREIYCSSIGIEYMDLHDPTIEHWFQARIERQRNRPMLTLENKRAILSNLNKAEIFERFLHTKYVGQKRFSLEGGETLIPAMAELIDYGAQLGTDDLIVGMAHRGRLNVLANILNKTYEMIFSEFEDHFIEGAVQGSGDVKYHKGFSGTVETASRQIIRVTLAANPSHLEAVDPVVEGAVRARQFLRGDKDRMRVLPFLIHGDAAFAGQGSVAETLNLSKLEGYTTGGTIHFILNNQIGFTTDPWDARSTRYASDIAKIVLAPTFHVNGDDPEAVVHCIRLAAEFRQTFHRDVVIDMVCYRRHGHNEGDEPSFTQPTMYRKIRNHPTVRALYTEELVRRGDVEAELAREMERNFKEQLQQSLETTREMTPAEQAETLRKTWSGYHKASQEEIAAPVDTKVSATTLEHIARKITTIPESFQIHPKLKPLLEEHYQRVAEDKGLDWGMAEALAIGTLLEEKIHVRLTGQDTCRGTFSHRHTVWYDVDNDKPYIPLNQISSEQARLSIFNSPLSELAPVGFEFGYSTANPSALVLWEAQFGDFANGAQIIIDQFISCSEAKWGRMSGLVLLLPHGYEGQGAEHSSARPERFLQMCAEYNMQVVNLTTPAQYFHALRRQIHRPFRKPLIVMSPKSLLRHPLATSKLADFSDDRFHEVLEETRAIENAGRVIFCCGKVYYDLLQEMEKNKRSDIAFVRLEQLYPFIESQVSAQLERWRDCGDIAWVQEEPQNMGPWTFVAPRLSALLRKGQKLRYVGRPEAASPAAGSHKQHAEDQQRLVEEALR